MKSLAARLSISEPAERRGETRWLIELMVVAGPVDEPGQAMVRNLSTTGLMLVTDAWLTVGERIVVDLPGAGPREAVVKWHRESAYGCAFDQPVSPAVIGAALLKAPLSAPDAGAPESEFEEFVVGTRLSIAEIADWKANFERTRGARGYRLIAYRQAGDGMLIAVAARPASLSHPR